MIQEYLAHLARTLHCSPQYIFKVSFTTVIVTIIFLNTILLFKKRNNIISTYDVELNTNGWFSQNLHEEMLFPRNKSILNGIPEVSHLVGSRITINGSTHKKLLTLFTSFKEDKLRENIQSHIIRNWALYKLDVQLILFTSSTTGVLANRARENGWKIMKIPRRNKRGTPFWKDMYFKACQLSHSSFYAYSNGDILYNEGLVNTLKYIEKNLDKYGATLLVGRRTNVIIDEHDSTPMYKSKYIAGLARKSGKLYRYDAEDYFIIGHPLAFPWHAIKNVVIGRPAYDNYIVGVSCQSSHVTVIDATSTVLAVHISGNNTNKQFSGSNNVDKRFNRNIIGNFSWASGSIKCAALYTQFMGNSTDVIVFHRPPFNYKVKRKVFKRRMIST